MTPAIVFIIGLLLGLALGAVLWRGRGSWDRADRVNLTAARCRPSHGVVAGFKEYCADSTCPNYRKETRA